MELDWQYFKIANSMEMIFFSKKICTIYPMPREKNNINWKAPLKVLNELGLLSIYVIILN